MTHTHYTVVHLIAGVLCTVYCIIGLCTLYFVHAYSNFCFSTPAHTTCTTHTFTCNIHTYVHTYTATHSVNTSSTVSQTTWWRYTILIQPTMHMYVPTGGLSSFLSAAERWPLAVREPKGVPACPLWPQGPGTALGPSGVPALQDGLLLSLPLLCSIVWTLLQ